MRNEISEYEKTAIASIHEWKNPQIGWFGKQITGLIGEQCVLARKTAAEQYSEIADNIFS